jgi:3-hydroxyisobutyrate dehydrogenase
MTDVAFIGTGLLASGMVEAMRRKGRTVTVWNRTPEKARALEAFGASVAATPEAAAAAANEIHIVLSDDAAVDGLLPQITGSLRPGAVVIDHTTASPAGTKRRLQNAAAAGVHFLHAPVFMSPQMCRDAGGLMLVSGPSAVFAQVKDTLERMTGEVWYLGEREDLSAANKLFGNSMIFVITAGLSDVFAMANSVGIPHHDAVALFQKFKVGNVVAVRGEKMAAHDFSASFELTMARKDLRLMIEAAGREPLALLPAIAERMDQTIAAGHGQDDLCAIGAPVLKSLNP